MDFKCDMDVSQFARETTMDSLTPIPEDVKQEQARIDWVDMLSFIYPVLWSDCPATMKGWFDRVLTYSYAYFYDDKGNRGTRIDIGKALVLPTAGHTVEHLEETGIADSMRRIMLNDRLQGVGVKEARMEILGGMASYDEIIAR